MLALIASKYGTGINNYFRIIIIITKNIEKERQNKEWNIFLNIWQRVEVFTCFDCTQISFISLLDYSIDRQHTKRIRRNYCFLMDHLDTDTGLLDQLYASRVLDEVEMEYVKTESHSFIRKERLISLISRKPMDQFQLFEQALRNNNQKHVADALALTSSMKVGHFLKKTNLRHIHSYFGSAWTCHHHHHHHQCLNPGERNP